MRLSDVLSQGFAINALETKSSFVRVSFNILPNKLKTNGAIKEARVGRNCPC